MIIIPAELLKSLFFSSGLELLRPLVWTFLGPKGGVQGFLGSLGRPRRPRFRGTFEPPPLDPCWSKLGGAIVPLFPCWCTLAQGKNAVLPRVTMPLCGGPPGKNSFAAGHHPPLRLPRGKNSVAAGHLAPLRRATRGKQR